MLQITSRNLRNGAFLGGKNRDRITIVGAILEVTVCGAKKTKIMYSVGLSFRLLSKYLELVVDSGLVRVEDSKYRLTERGREFLMQYRHFEDRYIKTQIALESLALEREQLSQSFKT